MTHLKFEVIKEKPKTKVYGVLSVHILADNSQAYDKSILGKIYWYGKWRQYVFEPAPDTIWSQSCLEEVYEFLLSLKN